MRVRLTMLFCGLMLFGAGLTPQPVAASSYDYFVSSHADYCSTDTSVFVTMGGHFATYGHIINIDLDWTNFRATTSAAYSWCGKCGVSKATNQKNLSVTFRVSSTGINSCGLTIPGGVGCTVSGNSEWVTFKASSTNTAASGYAAVNLNEVKFVQVPTLWGWPSATVSLVGKAVIGDETYYNNKTYSFAL